MKAICKVETTNDIVDSLVGFCDLAFSFYRRLMSTRAILPFCTRAHMQTLMTWVGEDNLTIVGIFESAYYGPTLCLQYAVLRSATQQKKKKTKKKTHNQKKIKRKIHFSDLRNAPKNFTPLFGEVARFGTHLQKKNNNRVAAARRFSVACPKTPSKVRVLGARDLCAPQPQRKGTHAQRRTKESERKQNRHKQHRQQWLPRRKYVTCHATPKCAATKSTTKTAKARKTNQR